ncbi:hypothetical protein RV134_260227 [Roseovarius sp. EC-HK134]|nr:hypothetical protein RV134_260227 [Roseovarius sp. EC-HK134]
MSVVSLRDTDELVRLSSRKVAIHPRLQVVDRFCLQPLKRRNESKRATPAAKFRDSEESSRVFNKPFGIAFRAMVLRAGQRRT